MKTNKFLKVLSAATIISTLAVVENSTQSNTTFAIENNAVAAKDIKNLPDGEYDITSEALKFYGADGEPSMAAAGLDNSKTKLIVQNGQYFVNVSFQPITFGGLNGYLGDLKYYNGPKTHANRDSIQANEFNPATIVEYYSTGETDNFVETYKKKFPGRNAYPKTLSYSVDKNKIDSSNKLETFTEVYVPVMASIRDEFGIQRMILKFDLSNALNAVENTQPTPADSLVDKEKYSFPDKATFEYKEKVDTTTPGEKDVTVVVKDEDKDTIVEVPAKVKVVQGNPQIIPVDQGQPLAENSINKGDYPEGSTFEYEKVEGKDPVNISEAGDYPVNVIVKDKDGNKLVTVPTTVRVVDAYRQYVPVDTDPKKVIPA